LAASNHSLINVIVIYPNWLHFIDYAFFNLDEGDLFHANNQIIILGFH